MNSKNCIIFTGGPGSGKTSLLDELQRRGMNTVAEVGRKIIREQMSSGGNAVPWGDVEAYARLMLDCSMEDYEKYSDQSSLWLFDRGIPDVWGYEKLVGIPSAPELIEACREYRYNETVFILPPWAEIYENDRERKQDFGVAVATYEMMRDVYRELEYKLIEVPRVSISARADFIENTLSIRPDKNKHL